MTDGNNVEHPSVVMTTESVDVTESASTNAVTSSSSHMEFYFQCAVVVIGIAGSAANALILYAMVASKQHKKRVLIFHQNVLDVLSSFLLIITYSLKLCNFYLTGLAGYWFCMLILSENVLWWAILASKTNLIFVTIERYLKAVYPVWSKNKLRKWMIYSAMPLSWISGLVHANALTFTTSDVIDGLCYAYVIWESRESQLAYGIWYFLFFYFIILIFFIFCYGHILIAIRRQAKVMASHGTTAGPSTAQAPSRQIQSSVVKTMILVSAFYAISELPLSIYYLMLNVHANLTLLESGYYATLFISFFYFCTNPFIYAVKFEPVKQILLRVILCKKTPVQPTDGSIEIGASRIASTRATQPHNSRM